MGIPGINEVCSFPSFKINEYSIVDELLVAIISASRNFSVSIVKDEFNFS